MNSIIKIRKKQPFDYILYSSVIVVGIILDQLTKWLSVKFLSKIVTFPIIENVIHLTYVENRGAAFGMLADSRWIFMVTSTVMIIGLSLYLYLGFAENKLYEISVAMIISGGIGNMIDRIALGYVVDFIDFRLINFAVFNGADSFVCVGAGLLIFALIRDMIKESRAKSTESLNKEDNDK